MTWLKGQKVDQLPILLNTPNFSRCKIQKAEGCLKTTLAVEQTVIFLEETAVDKCPRMN